MKNQTKLKRHITEETIERKTGSQEPTQKGLPKTLVDSFWGDFLKDSIKKSAPEQLFGREPQEPHADGFFGELTEGEEIVLTPKREVHKEEARQHWEYFRSFEREESNAKTNEQHTIERKIEEILTELKKIVHTSSEMKIMFKAVSGETMPVKPGKYHLTFFEWFLSVVKNARRRLEEGANWLNLFASKKKQKQYWSMYKKHGTTFGLSGERTTATQTG